MKSIQIYSFLLYIIIICNFFIIGTYFYNFISLSQNLSINSYVSSEASLGLTVETDISCGNNICEGAETCSTCSSDCGTCSTAGAGGPGGGGGSSSGGGSGGASSPNSPKFTLNNENFNLQIVSGNSESSELVIKNTYYVPITLVITSVGITDYILFNTLSITLAPGESKSLLFTINAPEPGVYAGKVIVSYGSFSEEALVLLNVVSEGVLFDATVTVPDLYRVLRAGQRLPVLIELTEVGDGKGVDVTMNYVIKDFNNDVKYTESETFYVQGTKSYSKRFSTAGLDPGDYVLGAELVYPGGFATSSAYFKISETVLTLQTWVAIIIVFVAIMVVIFSIIFFRRKSNNVIKLS